ncbi:MAG TPA: glycerol-3-phosphate 1-O-acyltransferase PlsY [Acidobacteriaceae bacterium]
MNAWIASIAIAYLLGSIPFGYVLVRVFRKEDIRSKGSGNIGATNVLRSGAKGLGFATLLLDMLKGLAAVLLARHIGHGNYDVEVAAAVAAVLGHVFPVWLGFRGGKGVATALGVFLALTWPSALGGLLVFIAVVSISRYVSLASIAAALALPLLALYFVKPWTATVACGFLFIPALVIVKHHANIGRLLNGTENRFGRPRAEAGKARA